MGAGFARSKTGRPAKARRPKVRQKQGQAQVQAPEGALTQV